MARRRSIQLHTEAVDRKAVRGVFAQPLIGGGSKPPSRSGFRPNWFQTGMRSQMDGERPTWLPDAKSVSTNSSNR